MDFTVEYQPTPDEVVRAFEQGAKHQLRRLSVLLTSLMVVAGVMCVLIEARSVGIALFVSAVACPFVMTWSLRRTARRQFAHLCVPTTLRFTADGYETRTDEQTMSVRWSFFQRVVTGEEFWLFFKDNNQFTGFLPKRAFTTEQQAEIDAVLGSR
ncbi:YcxB family protein [Nonomuraea terrae]|uniref:YcxB family protein n=1 Tax=Nonomuraea terrae TaxID=2530383 RepID=UPI0037B52FE9